MFKIHKIYILVVFLFLILFSCHFVAQGEQQFSYLANSFLHGKLYFIDIFTNHSDMVFLNGNYYWPLGPFPALLLMPFVGVFNLFHLFFYQGYLQFFLVILVFFVILKICQKINYSKLDSIYLAYAFVFSSMFLGVALISWSWYFSQVIVVLLIFLAIWEYLNTKRYWLIGLIFGLALLTRLTAGLGIFFFGLEIFFSATYTIKFKIRNLLKLIGPFIVAIFLMGIYNYLRFYSFLDQGYSSQILLAEPLRVARDYGLFSLVHVPGNIFYSLLSTPLPVFRDGLSHVLMFPFIQANPWGMSIFITSPWLLYLFFLKYKNKVSYFLITTIVLIFVPILLYYGIGFSQFGYRYALDFMPFLFLLFILNYKDKYQFVSKKLKILIVISSLVNLYLFFTFLC